MYQKVLEQDPKLRKRAVNGLLLTGGQEVVNKGLEQQHLMVREGRTRKFYRKVKEANLKTHGVANDSL